MGKLPYRMWTITYFLRITIRYRLVRKLHLDNGNKWFLVYGTSKSDDDDGGDLILYNPVTKEKDIFKYDTNKIILPNLPLVGIQSQGGSHSILDSLFVW